MTERLFDLILGEGNWLPVAMLLGMLAAATWMLRHPRERRLERQVIHGAMNRSYGGMIGVMGLGHLLGVSVAAHRGTLEGSLWFLYPLGLAIAAPAWWLCFDVARPGAEVRGRRTALLNGWLGLILLAPGPATLPLVVPAVLNLAYQFHSRRAVGWTIVTVTVAGNLALFVGALQFLASGQTFEQFSGM